jgi:non-heme chloroperoxidase
VVFSHGWPLSADAWDGQMLFLLQQGYRVIAHDRRGHGRSDQPDTGNDMDTYADDLAAVIEALDLRNVVLVGHSTGGGEIAHYVGRHGTARVAKMVLVGAVPPRMAVSDIYPGGLPLSVFDGIRKGVADNRSQFYLDLSTPFFGFNRDGAQVSDGLRQSFWRQGMQGSIVGQYLCVHEFSGSRLRPGPEGDRRAHAVHPRQRRPDRADRQRGRTGGQDGAGRGTEGL